MADAKPDLNSYTIYSTNQIVRPDDCVFMRRLDSDNRRYVAQVKTIDSDDNCNTVMVLVRWYYIPDEAIGGRRQFHGAKELFLTNQYDKKRADRIEGKCTVHSFKNYAMLENVGSDDFFCRFEYDTVTGAFNPHVVAVYCHCEMPYNPDHLMVRCEGCKDWFHPACIQMTIQDAKELDHFWCSDCSSGDDATLKFNPIHIPPSSKTKMGKKLKKTGPYSAHPQIL